MRQKPRESSTSRPVAATEDIDDYLKRTPPAIRAELHQAWRELVKLNPVLKNVKLDRNSVNELYDAINGVASGFNTDDLNFYLERSRGPNPRTRHSNPGEEKIENDLGQRMEWIVSPKTFAKVERKLHGKRGLKAA